MQLEAVTKSKNANEMGYKKSLMQFLFEKPLYGSSRRSKYIVQLVKNYRSHEAILTPSNSLFYENTLEAAASKGIQKYL